MEWITKQYFLCTAKCQKYDLDLKSEMYPTAPAVDTFILLLTEVTARMPQVILNAT